MWEVLSKTPLKFTVGADEIPAVVLKKLSLVLAEPLSIIYNRSLNDMEIPEIWKRSIVTPIHKKGPTECVENYRPISISVQCCKPMEKLLRVKMLEYCESRNLLSNCQHGFLSGRSTVTQLLEYTNTITGSLDTRLVVDAVYLDFSKAFDSVCHTKLLTVLYNFGFRNPLLGWIEAFLTNRNQVVKIRGQLSDPRSVVSGVPQGSVLGPLLFLLYVNDLATTVRHSKVFMFADDVKIVSYFRPELPDNRLQEDLDRVSAWADEKQLSLSIPKCSVIHFGRKNPLKKYSISGFELPSVFDIRDLGVIIDSEMKFTKHCNLVSSKASRLVACLFRCFLNRNQQFLVKMFNTFARPLLEYASPVWKPYLLQDIRVVERVQRSFTKRLLYQSQLTYEERLHTLNMEQLQLRHIKQDLIMIYKILYGYVKFDFADLIELQPPTTLVTRSQSRGLKFKKSHLNSGLQCRYYSYAMRIVDYWNHLSENAVFCTSVKGFKEALNSEPLLELLRT